MDTTSPDPDLPEIIDADHALRLHDAATELLDLAATTGDPAMKLHIDACSLCDELLFVHEAMNETHLSVGNVKRAADEWRLVRAARQLKAWHLDSLDRELDRRLQRQARD
jgi:hypothetical protein